MRRERPCARALHSEIFYRFLQKLFAEPPRIASGRNRKRTFDSALTVVALVVVLPTHNVNRAVGALVAPVAELTSLQQDLVVRLRNTQGARARRGMPPTRDRLSCVGEHCVTMSSHSFHRHASSRRGRWA